MKIVSSLLAAMVAATPCCCFGYVNTNPYTYRTDNANIQFLVNVDSASVNNVKGVPWITPGSDVMAAVIAAMSSWSSVLTANIHFATPQTTSLDYDSNSASNVISFDSGPEATALLNGVAIAVTERYYDSSTGAIVKTDIVFSTTDQFSTTGVTTAFDLQSVLTHELGHCLGSSHTGVLAGSMFQATGPGLTNQAHLSPDDAAFASAVYPVGNTFGTITGTMTDTAGNFIRGALISAQDPVSGRMIGGFSSITDGTFSFEVPPGDYYVWAEPLSGQVEVGNVYLAADQVDTNWQPVIAGGFASPSTIHVTAGQHSEVSLAAPAGASPIEITLAAATTTTGQSLEIYSGPTNLTGGPVVYFVFAATGLSTTVTDANFMAVGPVTIQPGSVHFLEDGKTSSGAPLLIYQLTLNAPSVSELTTASLLVSYNGNTAAFSGGLVVHPPAPAFPANGVGNAFSYASTAVAPGEIVALFGTNMGPAGGLSGAFNSAGYLNDQIEGISVRFDGIPAPLFYSGTGQINVQVPYEVNGESATSIVVDTGVDSTAVSVPVAAAVPGLYPSAVNADATLNSSTSPANAGDYVVLYATGLGMPTTSLDTGQASPGADAAANAVVVNIGGIPVTPAYAGLTPELAGLDQINLQIPAGLNSGENSLFVTSANGAQSQTISVWVQ